MRQQLFIPTKGYRQWVTVRGERQKETKQAKMDDPDFDADTWVPEEKEGGWPAIDNAPFKSTTQ